MKRRIAHTSGKDIKLHLALCLSK